MVECRWMGGRGKELGEIGESDSIESAVPTEFHLRLYMLKDGDQVHGSTRFERRTTATMIGL